MGNERSGGWPAVPIELTAEERQELERVSRLRIAPYREVLRARALLFAAAGRRAPRDQSGRPRGHRRRTALLVRGAGAPIATEPTQWNGLAPFS